jgi:hypothetical protein
MTDSSVSPAPPVEQALQSLRGDASERTPPPPPAVAQTESEAALDARANPTPKTHPKSAHKTQARAARRTQAKPDPAGVKPSASPVTPDASQTQVGTDAASPVKPRETPGGPSVSVDSALEALRTVSVSAQTRLANPEDFAELPTERDLSDIGPYVEHVMREAQAAAAAYRQKAERETTARAAKLLGAAAASAEKTRHDADAYGERTLAQADALLAERVNAIAELTGRLSQMAQLAGDQFTGDQAMRDQMMQFISALTATAEETVIELLPDATSSSSRSHTDHSAAPAKAPA